MRWSALLVCLGVLSASVAAAEEIYFPEDSRTWASVSPAEAGWDVAKLEAALTFAGERKSSGVVILLRGKILAERYWELDPPETGPGGRPNPYFHLRLGADRDGRPLEDVASVQKSVVSVLVGIAQEGGLISIDDPVHKHLGNGWSKAAPEAEAAITIRHLITMTSGLTPRLTFEAPAGEKWRYNTRAYAMSLRAVAKAAGKSPNVLTSEWLTGPLGMEDSQWATRPWVEARQNANTVGFATTARDLARFGLLILADGVWDGKAVLGDRQYLQQSTSPSQELNPSYGYLWWLNGQESVVRGGRKVPGWLVPTAPKDMVAAQGALGRKVYVARSLGLVVTRLGDAPEVRGQESFNRGFWKRLMAAAPLGVRTK